LSTNHHFVINPGATISTKYAEMVTYTCEVCTKEFKQKGHLQVHKNRKRPCQKDDRLETLVEKRVQEVLATVLPQTTTSETTQTIQTPQTSDKFTFIDLFCGIGGFHQALASLGGKCVLACDIDEKCREVYNQNYGIMPHSDVTKLVTADMPNFDILCGGFPCQTFSHAGKQDGFEDTRGTLFRDIARILRDKQPKFFLLENVKNLKGHDSGKTWQTIYKSLCSAGYMTYEEPVVMSPQHFGIPQHRERVLIMGVRKDLASLPLPPAPSYKPKPTNINSILVDDKDVPSSVSLTATDIAILNCWETFIQHFKERGVKLPTFPIWTDDWDKTYSLKDLPAWKAKFVQQNRDFYNQNKAFLESWLVSSKSVPGFSGAKAKLEWQCGAFQSNDSLWTLLFQYRPSGIRVKRATYSPALVALAQIVVVGAKKRRLCPREVARLQSFPDTFQLPAKAAVAYRQFGNAVNVEVIRQAALHTFSLSKDPISA
jgi:DNA (cytosine-5)-methyltransferase 1